VLPFTKSIASTWGYFGEDTLKLGSIPAMSNVRFLTAFNATSSVRNTYFRYGAWLGLAPLDASIYPFADSLIQKLHEKTWISRKIFTLLATSTDLKVTLGGFNEKFIAEVANQAKFTESLIKW